AQLVARLEHPHIVPLHDYWRNPDGAYLVMRWLGGGTLKGEIENGNLTIDQTHSLLADIGPALAFAHRRGVVHRDIKASNVLLDDEGGAYLTDFGIASDIALHGVGSVAQDVQALAVLLHQCIGEPDEQSVADLLATAAATERFRDVRSFIAAWEEAVGAGDETSQVVGYTPTRNPYKGLSAFGELDATDFHGRDSEIEEIIDTLAGHSLVAVVGPSGIGKSSVVRAGMIPVLRRGGIPESDQWLITDMLPGAYPYEELASALMRVATEMPSDLEDDLRRDARGLARSVKRYVPDGQTVLLIVDQFEELFTLSSEDERTEFLALLAATISDERSSIRIVITMRADFFDRPLRFADLGDALRAGTIPISAPNEESLRSMIEIPAAGVGVGFETGLVDRIIVDVRNQPGALPLLEFSLTELFDQRDSDLLTLDAYNTSGGVLAALGRRTETIYTDLGPDAQDATRDVFLRLVNVSDSGRGTRRRVRLTELERLGFTDAAMRGMLNSFGDQRLLTFDRDPITRGPTVEVAHEAILTEWPRLAAWIDEHREDLLLRSRLAVAVADWETADRFDTYLLTGGRLDQHEAWTADTELTLTSAEQEFLATSRFAEDERRAKRRRTRRLVMSGFGIAAVISLGLAAAALVARNDAQDQTALAEESQQTAQENETLAQEKAAEAEANAAQAASERQIAEAGELGAAALDQIGADPERALLLGIASLGKAATPAGINATHSALFSHYAVWTMLSDVLVPVDMPWALHPDGERVLVWEDAGNLKSIPARFALYDTTKPDQTPEWSVDLTGGVPIEYASEVVWFDDDVVLVFVSDAGINPAPRSSARGVYILDLETGEVLDTVRFGECVIYVYPAVSDLGRASPLIVGNGDLDEATNQCVPGGASNQTVRYFPGGVDSTDSILLEFPEPFQWFRFSPHATDDGQLIAFGTVPDLFIFDANTGKPVGSYDGDRIAISGDGDQLLISQINQGFVELVDRQSGDVIRTFSGEYLRITFSSDDTRFIGSSFDGGVHVFDLNTGTRTHDLRGTHYNPYQVSLADDPDTLLAASNDSGRLFKLGDRSEISVPMSGLGERLESWGYGGHHAAVKVGGGLVYVPFIDSEGTGYRIFDLDDGSVVREATDVWRVAAMTPDGKHVVEIPRLETGVTDPNGEIADLFGPMRLVDTKTGEVVLVFDSTCGFYGTDLSADIYVPHEDCRDGQLFLPLSDAEFSADGSRLGVDSYEDKPSVFDTRTGELLWYTVARDGPFDTPAGVVGLSPDGGTFIYQEASVDSFDQKLKAVDVETGESRGEVFQILPNYEIVFSEDGSRIYTANWAYIIYVYDAKTFQLVDTLTRGQGGGILDVAVRGNLVATVGFDKVVRVQTLDKHELMLELELEVKAESVEFLDDNHLLVITLSEDAFIFTMDPVELREIAKQRLTRGFTSEECSSFRIDPCPTLEEIRGG
ncbi:MAG: protein kinase, partial [Acidimicrobiia bacterium]